MKTYFFGVFHTCIAGHGLYLPGGHSASSEDCRALPFRWTKLDGDFLPPDDPSDRWRSPAYQPQGVFHLTVISGWTVLATWDRTGDHRYASNAEFVAEGVFTMDEMKAIAARDFPTVWKRIQAK